MSINLFQQVLELIKQGSPEMGYEVCFSQLATDRENKEVSKCLGLLSMVVGNHEPAEWYLQDSADLMNDTGLVNMTLDVMKSINDPKVKERWGNYRRLRNQQELKRMAETAPLCYGDVLEIGCANGDLSVFIASHGSNLYGVDIDPVAIDLARHKTAKLGFDNCRFQVGNGYQLQFPNHMFDTVVVAEVLEHVNDPKKIIMEAFRVCKPGGTIIISVPNGYSIPDPDHYNIFTKRILNNLVEFSIGCSLHWNDKVPNEWIMGFLIKPFEKCEDSSNDIDSYFLPQPYSFPKSDRLVSVIIPTYNRKEFIAETIQSILDQTHKNIEIIVVDDGSIESPKEELSPYLDKINYLYKENGGKSSALNKAIKHANGEFVWVFDDDDVALPLKLELQLKKFQQNPDLGLVHTRSIDFNDINGQVIRVHDLSPIDSNKLDFKMLMRGCFVHGPTVVFRKSCLKQLGGWDEELVRAQDYDFWLRLANLNRMEYLPVPTVRYRVHAGSRGSGAEPVSYDQLVAKTAKYEQIIFRKLYQSVPINEMYREAFETDNVTLMLEAFIDRAVILTARGLLQEAKQDLLIVKNNAQSFGNPCFSGEAIQNIHKLAQTAVQNNWDDHELVSSVFDLVNMVTSKD